MLFLTASDTVIVEGQANKRVTGPRPYGGSGGPERPHLGRDVSRALGPLLPRSVV